MKKIIKSALVLFFLFIFVCKKTEAVIDTALLSGTAAMGVLSMLGKDLYKSLSWECIDSTLLRLAALKACITFEKKRNPSIMLPHFPEALLEQNLERQRTLILLLGKTLHEEVKRKGAKETTPATEGGSDFTYDFGTKHFKMQPISFENAVILAARIRKHGLPGFKTVTNYAQFEDSIYQILPETGELKKFLEDRHRFEGQYMCRLRRIFDTREILLLEKKDGENYTRNYFVLYSPASNPRIQIPIYLIQEEGTRDARILGNFFDDLGAEKEMRDLYDAMATDSDGSSGGSTASDYEDSSLDEEYDDPRYGQDWQQQERQRILRQPPRFKNSMHQAASRDPSLSAWVDAAHAHRPPIFREANPTSRSAVDQPPRRATVDYAHYNQHPQLDTSFQQPAPFTFRHYAPQSDQWTDHDMTSRSVGAPPTRSFHVPAHHMEERTEPRHMHAPVPEAADQFHLQTHSHIGRQTVERDVPTHTHIISQEAIPQQRVQVHGSIVSHTIASQPQPQAQPRVSYREQHPQTLTIQTDDTIPPPPRRNRSGGSGRHSQARSTASNGSIDQPLSTKPEKQAKMQAVVQRFAEKLADGANKPTAAVKQLQRTSSITKFVDLDGGHFTTSRKGTGSAPRYVGSDVQRSTSNGDSDDMRQQGSSVSLSPARLSPEPGQGRRQRKSGHRGGALTPHQEGEEDEGGPSHSVAPQPQQPPRRPTHRGGQWEEGIDHTRNLVVV